MILNVLSVILDIVVLSVWFPPKYDYPGKNTAYTTNRFAAVMAIFNLIFRYVLPVCIASSKQYLASA